MKIFIINEKKEKIENHHQQTGFFQC